MKQTQKIVLRKEIKYIGFYDRPDSLHKRASALSATNKMDYICDAIIRAGYDVHIISPSWFDAPNAAWTRQSTVSLSVNKKMTLCPSVGTTNSWALYIKILFSLAWLFLYLLVHVNKDETILVYNATWLSLPVRMAKFINKFRIILEVEEINGDVWDMKAFLRQQEQKLISNADSYIVSSDILADKFLHKKKIILYGAYSAYDYDDKCSQLPFKFNNDAINIVFAGSIENTRCGAFIAVQCTKYLPKEYVLHILCYGTEFGINQLNAQILDVNTYLGRQACIFHGTLIGTEFSSFLRNCDIAINSQKEGSYMESAFPSKILAYLSHNLRVVSTRINSIQKSKICSLINFAANDTPEAIAHAISSINMTLEYDSRSVVGSLDEQFIKDIKTLFEE